MSAALTAALVVLAGAAACRSLVVLGARREVVGRIGGGAPPLRLDGALLVAALERAMSRRSARRVDDGLPELLDAVARALRSGAGIAQALDEAATAATGRLAVDVAAVVGDVGNGVTLEHALDGWVARCPTSGVRLTVAAIALAAESGGAAARAIDGVAETMRSNLAVAAEVRAQAAQARLSAIVIAVSPVAFGALAASTDGELASFMLRTPLGLACLVTGLALDVAAALWMRHITEAPA